MPWPTCLKPRACRGEQGCEPAAAGRDRDAVESAVERVCRRERARHRLKPPSLTDVVPHAVPCTRAGRVFHEHDRPVENSLARRWKPMESTGRFFLCACCRIQVVICSRCDRGQIYCAGPCAPRARRDSIRAAGRRYQDSRRGRLKHAERSRRYRARQNNVTHQASPVVAPDDLLAVDSTSQRPIASAATPAVLSAWRCHFCGHQCAQLVRIGPMRRRVPRNIHRPDRRGTEHDHSP